MRWNSLCMETGSRARNIKANCAARQRRRNATRNAAAPPVKCSLSFAGKSRRSDCRLRSAKAADLQRLRPTPCWPECLPDQFLRNGFGARLRTLEIPDDPALRAHAFAAARGMPDHADEALSAIRLIGLHGCANLRPRIDAQDRRVMRKEHNGSRRAAGVGINGWRDGCGLQRIEIRDDRAAHLLRSAHRDGCRVR